jgi:uncharacterized protein
MNDPGWAKLGAVSGLRPVAPPERVATLDILRGFALYGVLVSNTEGIFNGGWFGVGTPPASSADAAALWFVRIFVAGKAMTLLTFLFGLGFAIQLARADERGESALRPYARRLLVLLAIGLGHVALLWWGDVTWNYAVLGFALLAFRRCRPGALLAWALALVIVPQLVMALPGVSEALWGALGATTRRAEARAAMLAALQGGDYGAVVAAHVHQVAAHLSMIVGWYPAWVLGRFLLGHYAGARRLFERDGALHLGSFRRLLVWSAALAAPATAAVWLSYSPLLADYEVLWPGRLALVISGEASMLGLAAAYVALAVLLVQRPAARRALMILAPVGRMPLTVYLSQSLAATFVYYGWGLGLAGRVGSAGCLGISTAIFSLQVAACHRWLRRYRFGPVEWLWRTLAYGRRQPMRV